MEIMVLETSSKSAGPRDLVTRTRTALERAIHGDTKLPAEVLTINGMSGRKYRAFINNLVQELPGARYLEIGSFAGSTLCSAVAGNDVEAVAIDNWSQFGGPFQQFYHNLATFKGSAKVSVIERDFREVDYTSLGNLHGRFGIYLFDGPHSFEDQYDGIICAQPALEPRYVQIVDDWNWPDVRGGTMKAIRDLGLSIEFMAEIRTTLDDTHAKEGYGEAGDWHNGYLIAVLARPDQGA